MQKINCEKLFGVNVDYKLNFIVHLDGIIKKGGRKGNALILMNSFFTSHFSYCPLVWMFHSRTMSNKTYLPSIPDLSGVSRFKQRLPVSRFSCVFSRLALSHYTLFVDARFNIESLAIHVAMLKFFGW